MRGAFGPRPDTRDLTKTAPNADDFGAPARNTGCHRHATAAMNTLSPSALVFVVKLRLPDLADPGRLRGRVEHVGSGRRHDFDSSAALLACLAAELQELGREAGPDGDAASGRRPPPCPSA